MTETETTATPAAATPAPSAKPRFPRRGNAETRLAELLDQMKAAGLKPGELKRHRPDVQKALLAMDEESAMALMADTVSKIEQRRRDELQAKTDEFLGYLRHQHFSGVNS